MMKERALPWITFKAIEWLDNYLTKEMCVFEYGSGSSTVYFSDTTASVVSVEHNIDWFYKTKDLVQDRDNVNLFFHVPYNSTFRSETSVYTEDSFTSTSPEFKGYSFYNYVNAINDYKDQSFDLVVIDGRARASCIKVSLPKIKPGGYLLLDNSERNHYKIVSDRLLSQYESLSFTGGGPYIEEEWETTIWRIL